MVFFSGASIPACNRRDRAAARTDKSLTWIWFNNGPFSRVFRCASFSVGFRFLKCPVQLSRKTKLMIKLYNKDSGAFLGDITEAQLKFLTDRLEEESATDQDYYLNRDTVARFEQEGADPELLKLLKRALEDKNEVEVRWKKEGE